MYESGDDEQDDISWRVYQLDDGDFVRAGEGSPVAVALEQIVRDKRRRVEEGLYRMDWSLGKFGDLMWMRLPEARLLIFELAKQEFESAIADGEELTQLLPGDLKFEVFWWGILKPALDDYPDSRDVIKACCGFLGLVLRLEGEDGEYIRENMEEVFVWIVDDDSHRRVIGEIDSDLLANLDEVVRIDRER